MELHMKHTFHEIDHQFEHLQKETQNNLASLADSLVNVGGRLDSLATDVTSHIQHQQTQLNMQYERQQRDNIELKPMLHAVMAQIGIDVSHTTVQHQQQ